jgi:hypothetical protein
MAVKHRQPEFFFFFFWQYTCPAELLLGVLSTPSAACCGCRE